jgi:hypothetical protein
MRYDMWIHGRWRRRTETFVSRVPRHSRLRPSTESKAEHAMHASGYPPDQLHRGEETCDTTWSRGLCVTGTPNATTQQADDMCIEACEARPRQATSSHQHQSGPSAIESRQALSRPMRAAVSTMRVAGQSRRDPMHGATAPTKL